MKYGFTIDAKIRQYDMGMKFMKGQCSSYVFHLTTNRGEGSAISCSRMDSIEKLEIPNCEDYLTLSSIYVGNLCFL